MKMRMTRKTMQKWGSVFGAALSMVVLVTTVIPAAVTAQVATPGTDISTITPPTPPADDSSSTGTQDTTNTPDLTVTPAPTTGTGGSGDSGNGGGSSVVSATTSVITNVDSTDNNGPIPVIAPTQSCNFVSDTSTQIDGRDAVAVSTPYNPAWTATVPGAVWIWGEDPVTDTTVNETETFTKTFTMAGGPTSATLDIATDNGYEVWVNGTLVDNKIAVEDNFSATTTYNILPDLHVGTNTVTFTVENFGVEGSDESSNPAGLLYGINIVNAACKAVLPPPTTSVTLCKTDENGNPLQGWQLTLRKGQSVGQTVNVLSDGSTVTIPNVPPGDYAVRATGTYLYRGGETTVETSNVPSTSSKIQTDAATEGVSAANKITLDNNPGNVADAAYSDRLPSDGPDFWLMGSPYLPWVRDLDFGGGYAGYLGVKINGAMTDWGSIFNPNPNHKYWTNYDPTTAGDMNFNILDDNYGDNSGSLQVTVFPGFTGVTGENGCTTFDNVPYGDYQIHEIQKPGWTRIDHNQNVTVNADQNHFTVVNDDGKNKPPAVTVIAEKIICPDEAELPNAQGSSHMTDDETASDFLATHTDCHVAPDWTFEYGNDNAGYQGGSYIGHDPNYIAATPTDNTGTVSISIPLTDVNSDRIEFREQLQNGFIPFSDDPGTGDNASYSAELSCASDGLNYDNWEWINNPVANTTYYCVAWNVPQVSTNNGTLTIDKDTTNGDGTFDFTVAQGDTNVANPQITTVDGAGTTGDVSLAPGTYDVTETQQENWTLDADSPTCTLGDGNTGTPITNGEEITVSAGDHVTCTFNNTENIDDNGGNGGSGSGGTGQNGGSSGGGSTGGQVLGTSTTTDQGKVLGASCGILLNTYMKLGLPTNLADQVVKLQNFLNGNLGTSTVGVSGTFDSATDAAVRAFQVKYGSDVLAPWVGVPGSGITSATDSTGYVYKTTQWKINMLNCPDLDLPFPSPLT